MRRDGCWEKEKEKSEREWGLPRSASSPVMLWPSLPSDAPPSKIHPKRVENAEEDHAYQGGSGTKQYALGAQRASERQRGVSSAAIYPPGYSFSSEGADSADPRRGTAVHRSGTKSDVPGAHRPLSRASGGDRAAGATARATASAEAAPMKSAQKAESSDTPPGGSDARRKEKRKKEKGESAYETYAFFAKYTYSSECALLAYNFHTITNQLGVFEFFTYPYDNRLISVTLAYIFFKYKIHHCDMALDLALTLIYLEELEANTLLQFQDNDAFNIVCYLAFLAHVYNADRTIRLTDWYKEMNRAGAPRGFQNCREANEFVWFLFKTVRKLRLMPNEQRVKKYIQRLCAAPHFSKSQGAPDPRIPPSGH